MREEELVILAQKIKEGSASKEELLTFQREIKNLLSDTKDLLNDEE
ncbi:MAG: hypothetical protein WC928_01185 [Patescibacteria group bacterium]|jgi:hypothetical protein